MPRVYIRIESAPRHGEAPTPADEAATLRAANAIAEALQVSLPDKQSSTTIRGVTLRLDVD
ncbi:MAG: hypothetical protein M0R73_02585 [Dehalococcoidia bacterium]|nr:hypothetical protein [Dehalococcoidia bacterium]